MGREFLGWQKQSQSFNTVQGRLEKAINKVSKDGLINSIGSGRTDAGVHALGEVAIEMKSDYPLDMFTKGVNNYLPPSIRILEVSSVIKIFTRYLTLKRKFTNMLLGVFRLGLF